jgi:hypothetical protein
LRPSSSSSCRYSSASRQWGSASESSFAAGSGFAVFGEMGTPHVLMLAWIIVAILIVSTLVGLRVSDRRHHA